MRAAVWLRVSTTEQDASNQEPDPLALAAARNFEGVTTYRLEGESAYSGLTGYRVQLADLIADARARKFDVLLVWALDRLSREGSLDVLQLVDRPGRTGVQVVSATEAWTEAPDELRELLLGIAGWVARQEPVRRSERTRAGMARARR